MNERVLESSVRKGITIAVSESSKVRRLIQ